MDLDNEELEVTKNMQSTAENAEKTADEMFEELGYEKRLDRDDNPNYITYIEYNKDPSSGVTISFSLNYITVCADTFDEDYEINSAHSITPLELKAIYKKCKELGWL